MCKPFVDHADYSTWICNSVQTSRFLLLNTISLLFILLQLQLTACCCLRWLYVTDTIHAHEWLHVCLRLTGHAECQSHFSRIHRCTLASSLCHLPCLDGLHRRLGVLIGRRAGHGGLQGQRTRACSRSLCSPRHQTCAYRKMRCMNFMEGSIHHTLRQARVSARHEPSSSHTQDLSNTYLGRV